MHTGLRFLMAMLVLNVVLHECAADWKQVYSQSFDRLPTGTSTASKQLPDWEGGSAVGVVFAGKAKSAGNFLIANSAWTSFNQGPILSVDLSSVPHDKVRVQFDLYTFGEWRGLQSQTGGPQHRLMFFDSKATPAFSFDSNFSTSTDHAQSWPDQNPQKNTELTGAKPAEVDTTGRFGETFRWPIKFEYPSDSSSLRFAILCGAASGSGRPMPHFGIDNVRISVRSTAPTIELVDHPDEIAAAARNTPNPTSTTIEFQPPPNRKHSLGIFNKSTGRLVRTLLRGEQLERKLQRVEWDGLDNRGRVVTAGNYEWRLVSAAGLTARYVTTIGVNPPGGENPVPSKSWVGDHLGGGIVDVDSTGVYVGSPITEGGRMILKCDSGMSRVEWSRPQFYQSGRLTRIAASGQHVFIVHPNGKLRRLNPKSGRVESEWQIDIDKSSPSDIDARQANLIAAWPDRNLVLWLSVNDGKTLAEVEVANPQAIAAVTGEELGVAFVGSGRELFRVQPNSQPVRVATLDGSIVAMDFDPERNELWVVLDGHRVVRLDEQFNVAQSYGGKPRLDGPFNPKLFAGVYDIAADLNGGFFIGEPAHPPRRIAHFDRDGSIRGQWFGGMSFYVSATFDPDDPSRLIGIAPEGSVNVYRIDYETGTWKIEECYQTGRIGDGLFPFSSLFRAVRRNGSLYLYHRAIPAVLRLDPELRRAVPVAIAGRVLNQGRTFHQFAGSGRDGYPKPWVAAAEHHGFQDLKQAPPLYSWADSNGNGDFDPEEFRFYSDAKHKVSFHNPGDYRSDRAFIGSAGTNQPDALVQLPVAGWEGPDQDAPRWNWNAVKSAGEITADSYGYGSPRGLSVGPHDSVSVAYQAGIMIRGHGQYEGGGWPESALRGSRILGFDANLQPTFAVGRQSKLPGESNSGVLYYPMQTTLGPNRSVIVNDQTEQPAQVWTHDGLFIGSVFDHRASDGLAAGFYQVHGDDNQGATIVTTKTGRTYWLMPYQGHNRLYEITGWNDWQRQTGETASPQKPAESKEAGTGLTARYYSGTKQVFETTEAPTYYEPFKAEPHADKVKPHYKVVWSGLLNAPASDRFTFHSLIGNGEQVAVWVNGRLVHSNGFRKNKNQPVVLTLRHKHRIRIEYINPDGRAELKLLWSSRIFDPQRLDSSHLFPESSN